MNNFAELRMAVECRQEIIENYNMGFLNAKDLYCQLSDTYTWLNGKRWQWHLLCLLPKWMFSLYERIR